MACRPGPLRVGRSLRDLWTPFGVGLPLVAYTNVCAEPKGGPRRSRYTCHEVTAARAAALVFYPKQYVDTL